MKIDLLLSTSLLVFFAGCSIGGAGHVGLRDGKLSECPDSPNCVSSQTAKKDHFIDPLSYNGSYPEAKHALLSVISSLPRTKIIIDNELYVHVTFTSRLMRFVDDVEFLFDDTNHGYLPSAARDCSTCQCHRAAHMPLEFHNKQIHVRSASRVGYSDLGVNRKRVEDLRKRLQERLAIQIIRDEDIK